MHEATSVAINSKDEVFVFNRGNMPVLVFDIDGTLVRHWGNKTPFDGTHVVSDPYGNKSCRWIGVEFARCVTMRCRTCRVCCPPYHAAWCGLATRLVVSPDATLPRWAKLKLRPVDAAVNVACSPSLRHQPAAHTQPCTHPQAEHYLFGMPWWVFATRARCRVVGADPMQ